MDYETFLATRNQNQPPRGLHPALQALWFDMEGDWDKAHMIIQEHSDRASALVHAYLHRKEGDEWNARYWYKQAKRQPFIGNLEDEWLELVREFLKEPQQSKRAS